MNFSIILVLFVLFIKKTIEQNKKSNLIKFKKNEKFTFEKTQKEMILYIQIISNENIEYKNLDNYIFDETIKKKNHFFTNTSIIFYISSLDIIFDSFSIQIKNFEGYLIYNEFEKKIIKFIDFIPTLKIEDTYLNGSDTYNQYILKYHHNGLKTNYILYLYLIENKNNIPNSIYKYAEIDENQLSSQTNLIYKFTNDQRVEKTYSYDKIYIKEDQKFYGHLLINQIEEVKIYYLFPEIHLSSISFKLNYFHMFLILVLLITVISISCCICAICNCCVRITDCGLELIKVIIGIFKCIFGCINRICCCCCRKDDNNYMNYNKGGW